MPLVGYHLIGFEDPPLSFEQSDMNLVASTRHQDRTAEFFSHSHHDFNLFFHNRNWGERDFTKKGKRKEAKEHLNDYLLHGRIGARVRKPTGNRKEFDEQYFLDLLPANPKAINFVFTNNASGRDRNFIPLTPWMMAHRMGHIQMITQEWFDHEGQKTDIISWMLRAGYEILRDIYDYQIVTPTTGIPTSEDWNNHLRPYTRMDGKPNHVDSRVFHTMFANLLTTRAGRTGKLTPWWEYHSEWMAQYVRFDEIRLPPVFPALDLATLRDEPQYTVVPYPSTMLMRPTERRSTEKFKEDLSYWYERILTLWTGHVIVT
jgi:hypothetical protein